MFAPAYPNDLESTLSLPDVTDAIVSGESMLLFKSIGFRMHRVKVGSKVALMKAYSGLPPGLVQKQLQDSIYDVSPKVFILLEADSSLCTGVST